MTWVADLLKDFPALAVAQQRLALFEDELRRTCEERDKLREMANALIAENKVLKDQIGQGAAKAAFLDFEGLLWKRKTTGGYETTPYCPKCNLGLAAFPPGSDDMLVCGGCNYIAPHTPSKARQLHGTLP